MLIPPHRQLGREGQEKKDNWYRPHAVAEAHPTQIQERLPEGHTKGREGSGKQLIDVDQEHGCGAESVMRVQEFTDGFVGTPPWTRSAARMNSVAPSS